MMSIIIIISAFVITHLLCHLFRRPDSPLHILDHPNQRSLHDEPIPRSGGIAMFISLVILLPLLCYVNSIVNEFMLLLSGILVVAVISFMDDIGHVSPLVRLIFHSASAVMLVASGIDYTFIVDGILGQVLTILFIVWFINLYNFMDGMDGIAGGMGLSGFTALGLLGIFQGDSVFAMMCLTIASVNAGFLLHNFPPARIFMGDVGSTVSGYLAAAFSIYYAQSNPDLWWLPLLVFSPFLADSTVTLFHRMFRREKIWQAHRDHFYQKMVLAGFGDRNTVLLEYILMLLAAISALVVCEFESKIVTLFAIIGWIVVYSLVFAGIHRAYSRKQQLIG